MATKEPDEQFLPPDPYADRPGDAPAGRSGGLAGARGTSRKAIASLVLGILGLIVLPIVFSTLAIVFGALAYRDTRPSAGAGGRGMAIAGLVLGIVGLILGLIVGIALLSNR